MRIATTVRNALADAFDAAVNAGTPASKLQLRTGNAPAATTDAAAGTLLAEFTLPDPAFGNAASGVVTANAISNTTGLAAGTVGHFRVIDGDGVCVEDSQSVGTSGTELVINTTTVSVGLTMSVSSWTVTMPAGSV